MATLTALAARAHVTVYDHVLDAHADADVPVLDGLQAQGDVIIIPSAARLRGRSVPVPAAGIVVVAGTHDHTLIADGPVTWESAGPGGMDVGTVDVPDGATGWLVHPEHGANGIAPGRYVLRRQREQAAVAQLVAD